MCIYACTKWIAIPSEACRLQKTAPTATWSSRVIVNHQSKLNRRSTSVHISTSNWINYIKLSSFTKKLGYLMLFGDTYTSIIFNLFTMTDMTVGTAEFHPSPGTRDLRGGTEAKGPCWWWTSFQLTSEQLPGDPGVRLIIGKPMGVGAPQISGHLHVVKKYQEISRI